MMDRNTLTSEDWNDIFTHQRENGPFSTMALVAGGLNYLDRLNRKRLDRLASQRERTAALRELVRLEKKIYDYARQETPLSLLDADYQQEAADYIQMRLLFLKARQFTFARHRLSFLLDLIRLYQEDPCRILTGREALLEKWERMLFQDFILYDMETRNTDDLGKEAISNGYHECDYTLDIEDYCRRPMKAVPRRTFRYLKKSLPLSSTAACTLAYMRDHANEMAAALWVVDDETIWNDYKEHGTAAVTAEDVQTVEHTYIK